MKVTVGILVANLILMTANGYQRFPTHKVPLSESSISHLSEQEKDGFAEDLGSIAMVPELSEDGSARIFAAAKFFSPLNRKVIYSEHYRENKINQNELVAPSSEEAIEEKLASIRAALATASDSSEFFLWIESILTRYQRDPNEKNNSVYSFTISPSRIYAKFSPGSDGAFEYVTKRTSTFRIAVKEPMKHMISLHPNELSGKRVEFTSRHLGKNSCLACAILTKAYIKGDELDKNAAFCGGLSADGLIQKCDNFHSILSTLDRTSQNPYLTCVVLPKQNLYQLNDHLIIKGPKLFATYSFVGVSSIEEAYEWANSNQTDKVAMVTELFGSIQKVLKQPNAKEYLTNLNFRERLHRITSLEPNHISAGMIQKYSLGQVPAYLSLNYTISQISPLIDMINQNKNPHRKVYYNSRVNYGIENLKTNLNRIHPGMRKLVNAAVTFHERKQGEAELLRLYREIMENPNFQSRLNKGL